MYVNNKANVIFKMVL